MSTILIRPNLIDWFINMKVLLKCEHIAFVLEREGPNEPTLDALEEEMWG